MAHPVSTRLTASDGRKFGLTLGSALLLVAAIGYFRDHPRVAVVAAAAGMVLFLGALAVPARLLPVRDGWMRFSAVLSRMTTPIVMGVLFFVVMTPIGLLMRAFGRNPLRPAAPGQSAWRQKPSEQRRSNLQRQF